MKSGKHIHLGVKTRDLLWGLQNCPLLESCQLCSSLLESRLLARRPPQTWDHCLSSLRALNNPRAAAHFSVSLPCFLPSLLPASTFTLKNFLLIIVIHILRLHCPLVRMPAFQYFKCILDILRGAANSGFESFLFPFCF